MSAKLSVDKMLMRARSHEKKNKIADAEKIYQTLLLTFPKNKRAKERLTNLIQRKQNHVIERLPKEVINQLIETYNKGKFNIVIEQAQVLSKKYPKEFLIWNLIGASASKVGDTSKAINAFKNIILINPNSADAYYNMGVALKNDGQLNQGIKLFKKAILFKPNNAKAYFSIGNVLKEQGKLDQAIKSYQKAIFINPDYPEAYSNIGIILQEQDKIEEAKEAYETAISINPEYEKAHSKMAVLLHSQGDLTQAIKFYQNALSLNPVNANIFYNIGTAYQTQGNLEEAIKAYKKAIFINPNNAKVYCNIGVVLQDQGKLEEAVEAFKKATFYKPDYAEVFNNIGNALKDLGDLDAAIDNFNKAVLIKPNYPDAYYNSSFVYNLRGEFEKGLKLYEWRQKDKNNEIEILKIKSLLDTNRSLNRKKILIYEEQGLGDVIQFCRYLTFLKQKGAQVFFKLKKNMHSLIRTLNKDIVLIECLSKGKKYHFEISLLSLPYLFNTRLETIPSYHSYLFAEPKKIDLWKKRLTKQTFKIGICWQGSKSKIDVGRSFPLTLFKGISNLSNVELISLHKGEGEDQIKDIDFNLYTIDKNFDSGKHAFIDTAAVMKNCDLIITSDTVIAHLAGALGCRTWVVLKKIPDWRWMLNRNDTPWYPNMKLYRQKHIGDWKSVFDNMKRDLNNMLIKGMK